MFGYKGSAKDLKPRPCLQQGKFQKHTLHGKTYFVPCPSLRQSTTDNHTIDFWFWQFSAVDR